MKMPKINGTPISLRKNYKVKIILITESRSTLLDMVSMSASLKKSKVILEIQLSLHNVRGCVEQTYW